MNRWLGRRKFRKLAEECRMDAMRCSRSAHLEEFPSREFWDVETHTYLAKAWEYEEKAGGGVTPATGLPGSTVTASLPPDVGPGDWLIAIVNGETVVIKGPEELKK